MNSTAVRRIGAIAGAAAFATTFTISGTTASASTGQEAAEDRPCFMVRSHWNNAEGPQPTCPTGRFHRAASDEAGTSWHNSSPPIPDFGS